MMDISIVILSIELYLYNRIYLGFKFPMLAHNLLQCFSLNPLQNYPLLFILCSSLLEKICLKSNIFKQIFIFLLLLKVKSKCKFWLYKYKFAHFIFDYFCLIKFFILFFPFIIFKFEPFYKSVKKIVIQSKFGIISRQNMFPDILYYSIWMIWLITIDFFRKECNILIKYSSDTFKTLIV